MRACRRRSRHPPPCRDRAPGSRRATPARSDRRARSTTRCRCRPRSRRGAGRVLMLATDVIEALGAPAASRSRSSRATRRQIVRLGRTRMPPSFSASIYLRRRAEQRDLLVLRIIEQRRRAFGREGRAVTENERRAGADAGDQPVPHHPAAGGEIEHAGRRRARRSAGDAPSDAAAACRRPPCTMHFGTPVVPDEYRM